ncbi:MFS transporter [Spongiactinospora sp. TRM90649]|uniref:MFS transporter n=1 Tax=Spongiactinospora sp. TRM90649 TaxID=3031114 RepID=UPI0023F71EA8|nr:MFS transporter [Spongiactinospora sp. TRM90649]MDF5756989.1 MFS transporter [Spongiactinospora sp. TRM90649]
MADVSPWLSSTRLARAAVFAAVCVVVSMAGHAFAGGGIVTFPLLAVGAAGAFTLAWAMGRRERGPGVVLAATVGAQVVLHELFDRSPGAPDGPPLVVFDTGHGHPGGGMTLAHLVVALLTGWWLYRGESALWLMARLWRMPLPAVPRGAFAPVRVPPVRQAVPAAAPPPSVTPEVTAPIHRRGPPMLRRAGSPA